MLQVLHWLRSRVGAYIYILRCIFNLHDPREDDYLPAFSYYLHLRTKYPQVTIMPRPTYLLRVLLFLTTFNNVLAQLNGTQLIADTETGTPALSANCSDPFTGRANKCVAELKISQYIAGWLATHECYRGEAFSTCFLRQNDLSALDCESITSSSCTPPEAGPLVDPQVYYTSYNIYG